MYFYIDESGQTGLNLFDQDQTALYYGVLSSRLNLDVLALKYLKPLRKKLDVDRLHAAELGNGRLVSIVKELLFLQKKFDLRFDLHRIVKADHAAISFFDQVFDQGLNPALPWTAYWTPLRYILLIKLAYLFDDDLLKKAWEARIVKNKARSERLLVEVCAELLRRVEVLPDARSRELIIDALKWVSRNPTEVCYRVDSRKDALQISPNLIDFQSVLHGVALRLKRANAKAAAVVVDRQSEFNGAQEYIADFYHKARDVPWVNGPGLPVMDLKHIPDIPIACTPGVNSAGLELVDIYIWIFKRHFEGKEVAPELYGLIRPQIHRGMYDEVSIDALAKRWGNWFAQLPEPTADELEKAKDLREMQESRRREFLVD